VDEAKFLEQVNRHQRIIYKLVGLYASDAEEKKDLYQEIILQAWKSRQSFRGESMFSTWLYRVCLNTILTQKRKSSIVDYKDSVEAVSPYVQHSSIQKENTLSLHKAIRQLSETDRAIISLHLDGYATFEIAEMMGISPNHVAVKLHRSKQQLANLLTR
jgi:RNA polymerase sigma factor (sigma-70 family)